MRILIVDDHEIVREGLRATLQDDPEIEVVGAAPDGAAALTLAKQTLPDVALLDLRLPDTSGIELCQRFRKAFPSTAIVMLTTYLSEETVREAMRAGAAGYVTKAAGLPALRETLARIAAGETASPDSTQIVSRLHDLVSSRLPSEHPTPQQARVLELAALGLTNREIGARLYISESTVRFHVQKLKDKLSARTKTELIAKAIRIGLIAPAGEDGVADA